MQISLSSQTPSTNNTSLPQNSRWIWKSETWGEIHFLLCENRLVLRFERGEVRAGFAAHLDPEPPYKVILP